MTATKPRGICPTCRRDYWLRKDGALPGHVPPHDVPDRYLLTTPGGNCLGSGKQIDGRCCDLHNRHCEPPGDLCCRGCTEAAHDTFPIRHADGSKCVLEVES